jgi:hypothetical protein
LEWEQDRDAGERETSESPTTPPWHIQVKALERQEKRSLTMMVAPFRHGLAHADEVAVLLAQQPA